MMQFLMVKMAADTEAMKRAAEANKRREDCHDQMMMMASMFGMPKDKVGSMMFDKSGEN